MTITKTIRNPHVIGCPKFKTQPSLGYCLGIINLGSFLSLMIESVQIDRFIIFEVI
jgi:hypothetical protein